MSETEKIETKLPPTTPKIFFWIFVFLYSEVYFRQALLSSRLEAMLFSDIAVNVLFPILIVGAIYATARDSYYEIVLELKSTWKGVCLSVMLGFLYANFSVFFVSWTEYLLDFHVVRHADIAQQIILRFGFFGVLYLSITAAVVEELLFKSFLIRCFKRRPNKFIFCTVSSFLFVMSHFWQGPISMFFLAFLFAVPTAVYYYRTRNILNLIVFHFVADLLIFGGWWARI